MKLISRLTLDRDCDLDCDYALIDVSAEFAQSALRRIAVLKELRGVLPDLFEMYFWDQRAEYFSPWLAGKVDEADAFAETLECLPGEGGDLLKAPADFAVPEDLLARVECEQMVVREDEIAFVAIAKHTDVYVHTAAVPLLLLEAASAEGPLADAASTDAR
jgi:hypothetical protein